MLNNFIFLGQIPGTNLYISFYELQTVFLLVALMPLIRFGHARLFPGWKLHNPTLQILEVSLKDRARRIERRVAVLRANISDRQLSLFD